MTEQDCLFCKIVAGEVPGTVVRDSARTLAFRDINPQAPTHVLVVPKDHHTNLNELAVTDADLLAEVVRAAHEVAVDEGIAETGYRVVFNTGRVPVRPSSTCTPTCSAVVTSSGRPDDRARPLTWRRRSVRMFGVTERQGRSGHRTGL